MTATARTIATVATIAIVAGVLSACGADQSARPTAASPATTAAATPSPSTAPRRSAPAGPRTAPDRRERLADLVEDLAITQTARTRRPARRSSGDNPLAGRPWGTYLGPAEPVAGPYAASSGETRRVLSTIAEAPKAKWFGAWIPDAQIEAKTREYVAAAQAGDPETLVQLAMFRAVPWEHEACRRQPTAAEQASYRRWTASFARGIGDAHAAVVLQPDGRFALCTAGGVGMQTALIRYAATTLAALPHTAVYIEVGAADWPAPGQGGVEEVLRFLLPAGIEAARGIALNGTHYSATADEVRRGADVVTALEQRGITDKHVVINTSSNGRPFTYGSYRGTGRYAHPDNARPCDTVADPGPCVSLGIPPTADVTDERWGLPDDVRALAAEHVDAYLWFGRPWLYFQNSPFELDKALAVTRSSPWWGG